MKREPDPGALPALASQPISTDVLREKYLKPGEADRAGPVRAASRARWPASKPSRCVPNGSSAFLATCRRAPSAPAAS